METFMPIPTQLSHHKGNRDIFLATLDRGFELAYLMTITIDMTCP
jgi:hypothetical protein